MEIRLNIDRCKQVSSKYLYFNLPWKKKSFPYIVVITRGKNIHDIKSISLLDGEYGKPFYRYDNMTYVGFTWMLVKIKCGFLIYNFEIMDHNSDT